MKVFVCVVCGTEVIVKKECFTLDEVDCPACLSAAKVLEGVKKKDELERIAKLELIVLAAKSYIDRGIIPEWDGVLGMLLESVGHGRK